MTSELEQRIRRVLDERSLLEHPFFKGWAQGGLGAEQLREYARQYYHFELAFPRFLSAIHTRTESDHVRQLLLDNLWDEEHGERNHPALWLEFAAALGLRKDDVVNSTPNAETSALIEHFRQVSQNAPVGEALATLFAFEGQVPAMAWQTIKGLSDHYGFRPEQFEFFSVHLVSDISHSGAEVEAIQETATDADAILAATETASDKLLAFLDGCYASSGVR